MTPISDGENAILEKLANVAQQQAVTTERLAGVLEKIDDHMLRMDKERDIAVASLKNHITTTITSSERWWRRAMWILVMSVILSNLIGAAIDRVMPLVGK